MMLRNSTVTSAHAKADIFNKYFYSVFTHEDTSNLDTLRNSISFFPPLLNQSTLHQAMFIMNYHELANLDTGKACGPDHITPKLLKLCAEFICEPLSQSFNQSLSSGTLPRDWTAANITPIYKKGERCLVCNYKPISLTSIVVKVMERIICKQLISTLQRFGCIRDNQFGFRANQSTVILLLSAIHDWSLCLERRSSTHCVFLDFAKAFDSVPHKHLLLKLQCLGITSQLLQWVRSFLTSCFQ